MTDLDRLLDSFHDAAMCGLDDDEIREQIKAFARRSAPSVEPPTMDDFLGERMDGAETIRLQREALGGPPPSDDTRRLDWLDDGMNRHVEVKRAQKNNCDYWWVKEWFIGNERTTKVIRSGEGRTLRKAIDAAMSASPSSERATEPTHCAKCGRGLAVNGACYRCYPLPHSVLCECGHIRGVHWQDGSCEMPNAMPCDCKAFVAPTSSRETAL